MKWGEFVKEYFSFNRRDRIAILVLAFLVLLTGIAPQIITKSASKTVNLTIDTTFFKAIRSLPGKPDVDSEFSVTSRDFFADMPAGPEKSLKRTLFYFDPNTLNATGWKNLGLREKTISTIQKYLSKGGHFYKPEDLSRIYGISEETFDALKPYIQIAPLAKSERLVKSDSNRSYPKRKVHRYGVVDINIADTAAFIALPGIGSKLALRIVSFREKLGGFYSIEQVGETFGLSDSSFQKLKPYLVVNTTPIKKINLNTASVETLKTHPYIRYAIANAIIAYRNEHGHFESIEDIKMIQVISDELFNKLLPYLSID